MLFHWLVLSLGLLIVFYAFLLQAVLVAVVFSAPTNFNTGNGQFQGPESSFGKNQFQKSNEWNNNEHDQKTGQSDNVLRFQGFFEFYGTGQFQQPSQSENNRQGQGFGQSFGNNKFQGGNQPGNHGEPSGVHQPGQGSKPSNENKTKEHGGPPHGFNFPTGIPFTGVPGHFGGMTHEPGFGHPNVENGHRRSSTPSGKSST